jgi:hypothetical protein
MVELSKESTNIEPKKDPPRIIAKEDNSLKELAAHFAL